MSKIIIKTEITKFMEESQHIAKELEPIIKPLYRELIGSVKHINGEKDTFAIQWGKYYPSLKNNGLLFVGRATNEWHTTEENIDVLFGDPRLGSTIFNCYDQMEWVYNDWDGEGYATKRSAFWRVIRSVSKSFYPEDELNHVAWSNVCKIQMDSGNNPSDKLFDCQIQICQKIFKAEIDVLSPKIVVMFIGGYGKREILSYMNNGSMPKIIETRNWDKYKAEVFKIDKTIYICTEHPMCKKESDHVSCLISLIRDYNELS